MQPSSLDIGGNFRRLWGKAQDGSYVDCTGVVKGRMERNGMVFLQFINMSGPYDCRPDIYNGPFKIEEKDPDIVLSSTGAPSGFGENQPACRLQAKSNRRQITITSYSYAFSKVFLDKVAPGTQVLNAGKIEVAEVNQVLLAGTDTVAEGSFNWRAEVNKPGEAYLGMREVDGQGRALFRKQPDGAWVCAETDLTYPDQLGIR
jgi:hypothetical protein